MVLHASVMLHAWACKHTQTHRRKAADPGKRAAQIPYFQRPEMTLHGESLLCFEDKRGECFSLGLLVSRILGETRACGLLVGQGPTRRTGCLQRPDAKRLCWPSEQSWAHTPRPPGEAETCRSLSGGASPTNGVAPSNNGALQKASGGTVTRVN